MEKNKPLENAMDSLKESDYKNNRNIRVYDNPYFYYI